MRNSLNSVRLSFMREVHECQPRRGHELESDATIDDLAGDMKRTRGDGNETKKPREIGGPKGAEPTRFGDWERAGRCIDF